VPDRSDTTAFLLTHQSSEANDRNCLRFVTEGLGADRSRILFDLAKGHEPSSAIAPYTWTFDSREMGNWGYSTIRDTLIPGHAHLPLLRYFEAHPGGEYFWLVEDDVGYRGSWKAFFESFRDDDSDFLACHIRSHSDEPSWPWWRTLEPASGDVAQIERVRALLVVARYSRRALETIIGYHRSGWRGHFEALCPTVIRHAGLTLADIGGTGPFTPKARWGRHYTSYGDEAGSLWHIGSVRYRPHQLRPGWRSDRLYHPVKVDGPPTGPLRWRLKDIARAWIRHAKWRWSRRRAE
jgi:hypothetical protein